MKKFRSILVISLFFTLIGCNQDKIDELQRQNQELEEQGSKSDSSINEMLATFNKIQTNLKEIKAREGVIEINSAEGDSKQIGETINNDIETINNLMQENEKLMAELNEKLSNSNVRIAEFKNIVKNLNNRVESKNEEIERLSTELQQKKILIGRLYFKNDSLNYSNQMTKKQLEEKIDDANKVYYAFGTYKELKEQNVLTKEGGFLGLGKNEELKDNFNRDYFSQIDKTKQNSFLLYAKEAEVITAHPRDSYKIMGKDGAADSLVITDAKKFWEASNYLVVVVD